MWEVAGPVPPNRAKLGDSIHAPIIGAKHLDQLDDNLAAVNTDRTEQEPDTLDQVSKLLGRHPGWMFDTESSRVTQFAEAGRKTAR